MLKKNTQMQKFRKKKQVKETDHEKNLSCNKKSTSYQNFPTTKTNYRYIMKMNTNN